MACKSKSGGRATITGDIRMTNVFNNLREWSHSFVALVGALIASFGGAATIATVLGAHISQLPAIQGAGLSGFIATLASKFIDSANNAANTTATPIPPTPPAPAPPA